MPHPSDTTEIPRLLGNLPIRVSSVLRESFRPETYVAGNTIFREGDSLDRIFIVASGHVALEMHITGHGRRLLLSIGAGDLLGWSPVFDTGPMSATAIALEQTELWAISADELRRLCETDFEVGYYFMRELAKALSQRLVATRLQLLDLFQQDAPMSDG